MLDHIRPAQVVDGDLVGATQRIQIDALDVVEVHNNIAEVAGDEGAIAIGRDLEYLASVTSVEKKGVEA